MKSVFISVIGNRKAEVFDDAGEGRYYLHLYEDGKQMRNLFFPDSYTQKHVEQKAREWTNNESKAN